MAERLYRDAVQRGRIPEDIRIPLASLGQEAGEICTCQLTRSTLWNLDSIAMVELTHLRTAIALPHYASCTSCTYCARSTQSAGSSFLSLARASTGQCSVPVVQELDACTGNTGLNGHASGGASAALPRSSLPDRLQAAPAQLPVQQPARRGLGQGSAHRPVIGGMHPPLLSLHCQSLTPGVLCKQCAAAAVK